LQNKLKRNKQFTRLVHSLEATGLNLNFSSDKFSSFLSLGTRLQW